MPSANEMIDNIQDMGNKRSMPMHEIRQYSQNERICSELTDLSAKLEVIFAALGVDLDGIKSASTSLVEPIKTVKTAIEGTDKLRSLDAKETRKMLNMIGELIRGIKIPEVKIPAMPTEMKMKMCDEDKEHLKPIPHPEFPKQITVSNLNEISSLLKDIDMQISMIQIPSETRVSNLADIKIPEQKALELDPLVLKYLSRLELLTTDAKNPLSVQLSDGREFYQAIGNTIATTMGGIKDPTIAYKVADVDDAGTTKYYGFTRADGKWMIMKEVSDSSPKTYRYSAGSDNYSTNFSGRASLTYGYFHEVNI